MQLPEQLWASSGGLEYSDPIPNQERRMTQEQKITGEDLERLCINTIRFLSVDAVERARSGHPGGE